MSLPTISIVTATYNSVATLASALDAVAAQSYRAIEHIAIDGGSVDGTLAMLQQRQAQLSVLVSEPDRGIYDALNKGISHATGDVIGFLHSDDFYPDASVIRDVAQAFTDSSVSAVYGDLDYVKRDNVDLRFRRWVAGAYSERFGLSLGWMPPHPTLFVRRALYERIGGFDTSLRIAADYHSILKLFGLPGFRAIYLPRVLVKMRAGGASNRSLGNIARKTQEDLMALHLAGRRLGWLTVAAKNLRKLPQLL